MSIHLGLSILHKFSFVRVTPVLDLHNISNVEPIQQLYLGISNILNQCALETLRSVVIKTNKWLASGSRNRAHNSIRTLFINQIKTLVKNELNRSKTWILYQNVYWEVSIGRSIHLGRTHRVANSSWYKTNWYDFAISGCYGAHWTWRGKTVYH